jgi:hypothetical protein
MTTETSAIRADVFRNVSRSTATFHTFVKPVRAPAYHPLERQIVTGIIQIISSLREGFARAGSPGLEVLVTHSDASN